MIYRRTSGENVNQTDPIRNLAEQAKADPEFYRALAADPDRVLAELAGVTKEAPVKRIDPKKRVGGRSSPSKPPGKAGLFCFDATCGDESCQFTCGPRSCGFTCSLSCTGDTCKSSCGHTTGIQKGKIAKVS